MAGEYRTPVALRRTHRYFSCSPRQAPIVRDVPEDWEPKSASRWNHQTIVVLHFDINLD